MVGIDTWFEFFTTNAPLLTLLLLGLAGGTAYRDGEIIVSCLVMTALLVGMVFAIFGVSLTILNVVDLAIFADPVYGVLDWIAGVGAKTVADEIR